MVDRQNRDGVRFGTGAPASDAQAARARRERLRQLALETFDVSKDPYIVRNRLGTLECKLCATVHATEGSYLAHTQGKRHQTALQQRAERDIKLSAQLGRGPTASRPMPKKSLKIGRPGYKVTKFWEDEQRGLEFELYFPDIEPGLQPRHSFMSSFEQKVEAPDRNFQYLIFAANPYESVAFKIPNMPLDKNPEKFTTNWNKETKTFTLRLLYKPIEGDSR
jgi:splicing factor 3A subunit 2